MYIFFVFTYMYIHTCIGRYIHTYSCRSKCIGISVSLSLSLYACLCFGSFCHAAHGSFRAALQTLSTCMGQEAFVQGIGPPSVLRHKLWGILKRAPHREAHKAEMTPANAVLQKQRRHWLGDHLRSSLPVFQCPHFWSCTLAVTLYTCYVPGSLS